MPVVSLIWTNCSLMEEQGEGTEAMTPLDAFLANAALEAGYQSGRSVSGLRADDDASLCQGAGVPAGLSGRYGGGVIPP